MDPQKLKVKIGDNEFEAEGPVDIVQSQFEAWKELVLNLPFAPKDLPLPGGTIPMSELLNAGQSENKLPLDRILKVEGRVVSLTAKCETIDEAILLILLGQKELRNNQEATGAEIMDGLNQSGYKLNRVDSVLNRMDANGSTITMGVHRGRRYRLSNAGLNIALGLAREVIATVPK